MGVKLNPYITFDGTAREAMTFYHSVLGGDLTISTFGEFGGGGDVPADGVMHAQLAGDHGVVLMASDTPPGMPHTPGSTISVSLFGDDVEVLRGWWDGLSEGGQVVLALEKQVWGDTFGMLTDRFGISWMVNIAGADTEG